MNTGIVSSRYASALLKYSDETGSGETVYRQALSMSGTLASVPQLRAIVDNPMSVPDPVKYDLLLASLGGEPVAEELGRFIRLVMKNRRLRLLRLMLLSFISQYRQKNGIRMSRLVTATPSPELEDRISSLIEKSSDTSVIFDHRVDPDLIGGFIFEMDGYRIDASVASQLKSVRRQFIEKNRRIV